MATVFTHSLAALIIGKSLIDKKQSPGFWLSLVLCSLLPDIDVVGIKFGIAYGDFWGHRGFTHSLCFAVIVGFFIGLVFYRRLGIASPEWCKYVVLYSTVTASHGIFDAMTNGGLGIAFFAPFDNSRYFLPWTPVQVTRVGFYDFFSHKGFRILMSEGIFILTPMSVIYVILVWRRRRNRKHDCRISE
ncbi:MAG: metal-dependent hydrolase [Gammaproteobacteria bacterium]|nr:metal-dependent hydrolase [Gammaproteobacteria bacterium]